MTQWERTNGRVSTEESFILLLIKMDEFIRVQFPAWAYEGLCACDEKRRVDTIEGGRNAGGILTVWSRFPFLLWSQGKSELPDGTI